MQELPIIQKTYDLIKWYVPILNKLPRDHKFNLGYRMTEQLYNILEDLIRARYATTEKRAMLQTLNVKLDILRYQTRLLLEFNLMNTERYEYVSRSLQDIGTDLGGWIKQQKERPS